MAYKTFKHRRDTAANWATNNPTLAASEIGYETDTGNYKFGDGSTAWNSLGYSALLTGLLQDLDTLGPNSADSEFIVGTGAGTLAWESGNTARTSLGLGTGDSPTFTGLTVSSYLDFDSVGSLPGTVTKGRILRLTSDGRLYYGAAS